MSPYKAKQWVFTGTMLWRWKAEPVFLHPVNWPWKTAATEYRLCPLLEGLFGWAAQQ